MPEYPLNAEAWRENVRALALAAGLSEEEAAGRLDATVLITHDPGDPIACALVAELVPLLARTLGIVHTPAQIDSRCAVELVIGRADSRSVVAKVFVTLDAERLVIQRIPIADLRSALPHPLMVLIAACYVAGAAISAAVGEGFPNPPPADIEVPFSTFLPSQARLDDPIPLGEAYLAGAGAIGNGLLWAARHVHLIGTLHVVDDDSVSPGNLQRQVWFDTDDIGEPKAERLAAKAQPFLRECNLAPAVHRLQEHPARNEGAWLKRLIVAVDSRRARRHLQNELPGEVFDASTTGSQEIVLHHNKRPTSLACLGCVYPHDDAEVTHEQAIADQLGIDVESVLQARITPEIARRICATHTQLDPTMIEGVAFDTLYKQLCGSAQLKSIAGRQVVAPFAFVSALAGALLLLEIIRRTTDESPGNLWNEWRVNPWWPPVPELRYLRPPREGCECCGRSELRRINVKLWGEAAI